MKIAYVTTYNASDIYSWSGTGYYIQQALMNSGFEIENIGNLKDKLTFFFKIKKILYSRFLSKKYLKDRDPLILKHYSSQVEKALVSSNCDVVFCPGTLPIAYLQTDKPIVFWADATFAGMVDFYPSYSDLCTESIRYGNKMEQLALSKCRVAIYTSEWAAKTAIENYDVDPAKVKVVPFGANISCNRNFQDIEQLVRNKSFETCKLLFVGVDWTRKGGDVALAVTDILNQRGIKTELHVVGCTAPGSVPDFVIQHGFASKKTEEGRNLLDKLMSESHFLILPSRAECYGLVFAEASSFGLPSLASNVGGIPTVIQDGKNGQTFPLDDGPSAYCDYIQRFISSNQEYDDLALSSFNQYFENLNWEVASKKVHEIISQFCS